MAKRNTGLNPPNLAGPAVLVKTLSQNFALSRFILEEDVRKQ